MSELREQIARAMERELGFWDGALDAALDKAILAIPALRDRVAVPDEVEELAQNAENEGLTQTAATIRAQAQEIARLKAERDEAEARGYRRGIEEAAGRIKCAVHDDGKDCPIEDCCRPWVALIAEKQPEPEPPRLQTGDEMRRARTDARSIQALELREQGLTFREVGERLGIGRAYAKTLAERGDRIRRFRAKPRD